MEDEDHLRLIANKHLLVQPRHTYQPLPYTSFQPDLQDILKKQYTQPYIHPKIMDHIISMIDSIIIDYQRDIFIDEEVHRLIEDVMKDVMKYGC